MITPIRTTTAVFADVTLAILALALILTLTLTFTLDWLRCNKKPASKICYWSRAAVVGLFTCSIVFRYSIHAHTWEPSVP